MGAGPQGPANLFVLRQGGLKRGIYIATSTKAADAREVMKRLAKLYPNARIALNFSNPLELLVATILSAQSTDVGVNKVTPALFARYKTAADYAGADVVELENLIKATGFYHNKAKSVMGAAKTLVTDFKGQVPRTMPEIITLPGVARKTGNVSALQRLWSHRRASGRHPCHPALQPAGVHH